MKKKIIGLLKKVYDRNEKTGAFIVKTSIDNYTDIFNELDPSPLRRRDLDQDFIAYLVDCSLDIPMKYKLELHIEGPKEIQDKSKEERVKDGIRTYCNLVMLKRKEELNSSYKQVIFYIFIFLTLISIAFTFGPSFEQSVITETLREGIFIGGWVFLWEAIAILFLKNKKTILEFKRFERLENAEVEFIYY